MWGKTTGVRMMRMNVFHCLWQQCMMNNNKYGRPLPLCLLMCFILPVSFLLHKLRWQIAASITALSWLNQNRLRCWESCFKQGSRPKMRLNPSYCRIVYKIATESVAMWTWHGKWSCCGVSSSSLQCAASNRVREWAGETVRMFCCA